MFDLNDKDATRVKPARTDESDQSPGEVAALAANADPSDLDSDDMQELQGRLVGFYRQELNRQGPNRAEMATDEDYHDNIQWTAEEEEALRERGQAATVYNVISQSVNWIIGSEKRGRSDFKVLPRRKDGGQPAQRKTALLKYLSDVNHTPFERSIAFEESTKAGLGWLESQIQDEDDGEPIYAGAESWRNIIFDSTHRRLDQSDMRYLFRVKWVDLDVAIAIFPDRQAQLESASVDNYTTWGQDDFDGDYAMDSSEIAAETEGGLRAAPEYARKRVRLIEGWFRMPERVPKLKGRNSDFRGEIYDENDERHQMELATGRATLAVVPMMRMYCCVMTTQDMLCFGPSPYRHNRYPFTPVWGFRRARDGMPYGVIRWMRGMQDDVNKRLSKALYILSTNKVIMDEGAVDDIEEFRREVARPDAIIEKRAGKQIELNVDRDLAPSHLELASRSISMIQQVGGVTDELLGKATNAISGVAIQARQDQGTVGTNKLFDNLRLAWQMHGEKELSLIEQYMTEEKQFRITNQRGTPEYVTVNSGLPEDDITRTKADFIIDEADWRASMRQAAAAGLMDLAKTMPPQIVLAILDLLVENMDIANRDEIVKRIRAINGQRDPDQEQPTPQEIQAQQAAQQQQQMQEAMQQAQLETVQAKAQLTQNQAAEASAKADLATAQASKAQSGTKHIDMMAVNEAITAIKGATDAATAIAFMPQIAGLSDGILEQAGWTNPNPQLPVPAQAATGTPPAPAAPAMPANPALPAAPGYPVAPPQQGLPPLPPGAQPPGR